MQPDDDLTAAPIVPTAERFTVGLALSRSFGVWLQNLPFFLGVALAAHVPGFLLTSWQLGQGGASPTSQRLENAVTNLLGYLVTGLVTYSVIEQLRGRKPRPARSLSVGWAKFGPLLGTAIVTGFLTFLLLLVLIVPGVIAAVRWCLVSPIVVAEDPEDPRVRSSALTAGHRWELFGLLAFTYLGLLLLLVPLGVMLPEEETVWTTAVTTVPTAVFLSYRAVLEAVTYSLLRSEKDGIDLDQLAAVFE